MKGYQSSKTLARDLEVRQELIDGLVQSGQLAGVVERGKSGQLICFVTNAEAFRLRERFGLASRDRRRRPG